jgi:hypothetical protein
VGGLIGSSNCCTEGHFPRLHGQAIVQGFFLKERSVSLVPNAAQLAHFRRHRKLDVLRVESSKCRRKGR